MIAAITSGEEETMSDEKSVAEPVCPYVTGTVTRYCTLTPFTLADAEREAVQEASEFYIGTRTGVALRGLLERLR